MELLLPVALAASLSRKRSPLLPAACAGLMFASVIASASRACTLIVCAGKRLPSRPRLTRRRNYRAAGLVAASLILCTLLGGWSYVWERFSYSDPFEYRREMLTATIAMIRARPLTGFGLGAWPSVYPAFAVFDPPGVYMNHAHNDWAEWTGRRSAIVDPARDFRLRSGTAHTQASVDSRRPRRTCPRVIRFSSS